MEKPLNDIQRAVLGKLVSRKVWGRNHISIDTLLKCGWKSHERGAVKTAIKNLINMGSTRHEID